MNTRHQILSQVYKAIGEVYVEPSRETTGALQALLESLGVAGTVACEQSARVWRVTVDLDECSQIDDYDEEIAWRERCDATIIDAVNVIRAAVEETPAYVAAAEK